MKKNSESRVLEKRCHLNYLKLAGLTENEWRKEMFYLTMHSTHFMLRSYGVKDMVKDHSDSLRVTRCRHIGYSFQSAARFFFYASSHRQDNTYHSLCYTNRGALAGTRNSSMGSPWRIDPTTHRTITENYYLIHCVSRIKIKYKICYATELAKKHLTSAKRLMQNLIEN